MKVLLDTDIGSDIDDAVCLADLLAQPQCELLGVTTVSGQPRLRAALASAVGHAAGRVDVPIHAGTEDALLGPTPQPDVPQAAVLDRFSHQPANDFAPNAAVEFLRDVVLAHPGEIILLTIGPLTNVALLFATYPDVAAQLAGLVMMAGVFSNRTPGAGPVEWNIHCDPHAAGVVYRTRAASHRSVGLDVTMRCTLDTGDAIARFTMVGGALAVVAAATEVWGTHADRVVFHDPLAGVSLFQPDVCEWTGGRVSVEMASRRYRGATAFDAGRDDSPHEVATTVDPDAFFAAYFSVF
jgi:inosine-uridine nucleoside N-ribohydrolase